MNWINFLHIYQPSGQDRDVIEAVTHQSYRPLLLGIKENKNVRVTFNISGALFEVFDKYGYIDVIELIRELVNEGRLELTGSSKYHAFLPFLDEDEIKRQIEKNTETLRKYLGKDFTPKGFFPPEMAYDPKVSKIVSEMGFEWMILDEISFNGKVDQLKYDGIHKIKNTNLKVIFRERRPSNLIMSSIVRSAESLVGALGEEFRNDRFMLTAMDGETFGHHRPGLEKLLFEIFKSSKFNLMTVSDVIDQYEVKDEIDLIPSTWASSEDDIKNGIQFLSWNDPENIIHSWQKELVDLALKSLYSLRKDDPSYQEVRNKMDEALASDHFWWASAKPWWSIEEIEKGAFRNLDIVRSVPNVGEDDARRASELYEKIISTAFNWKRTGKIYQMMSEQKNKVRIPFKERTLEKGGIEKGIYEAFMSMFEKLEREAVDKKEYEKAILWRDAIYKIETKNDIYDAVHAIELLRLEIPNFEVEKTLDKYTEKYKEIRGGQPEQRGA